jgi:pimeloyl-ACP methyl ester carboxylesterase
MIDCKKNKTEAMKLKTLITLCLLSLMGSLSAQTVAYGDNKDAGQFISINGVNLYYETYGSGAPLLLIHGNTTGIKGWKPQIEHFSKKYKVIAVDCRGRGKSELGKDSLTYIGMAHDLSVLLEKLKFDSVTVVGKSDGGIVGILMGIYYPQYVKQIVAFGANMWPDATALYAETVNDIKQTRIKAEEMLAKKDTTKNWFMERQLYRLMEFQPHVTAKDLAKIKVPVLIMSCDRDVIMEEHSLFMYRSIPKSNLSILSGQVHRVATLNPDLFNATVDTFISQPFKDHSTRFK